MSSLQIVLDSSTSRWAASVAVVGIRGRVHHCHSPEHVANNLLGTLNQRKEVGISEGEAWFGCDVAEVYARRAWLIESETEHERSICMWPGFNSFSAQICLSALSLMEMLTRPDRLLGLSAFLSQTAVEFIERLEHRSVIALTPGYGPP